MIQGLRRPALLGLALAACVALAACMLAPGKFSSALDLRRDGRFSFTYTGEIHLLALSRLAEMGQRHRGDDKFEPVPCHNAEGKDRPCTEADLNDQKTNWEESRRISAERSDREAASIKAILGGIDPADPGAAEEFAQRLRRQQGWRKVVYKGEGLFEVDFSISGRMDHDFIFPVIERFPSGNVFVQAVLRGDGSVRIDAPGFAPTAAGEPYRGFMQGAMLSEGRVNAPKLPELDGTFVIRTDGEVLANNTEEGPRANTTGQELIWAINARTPAPPTALIRLAR